MNEKSYVEWLEQANMNTLHTTIGRVLRVLALLGLASMGGAWGQGRTLTEVEIRTSLGSITIELYPDTAPNTVRNFLQYVNDGFYSGTIFHRVIDGFMIQGGGLTSDMGSKPTRAPIALENVNRLTNELGTVAMARTNDPNSGRSQFFINVADNKSLDYRGQANHEIGYVVFGRVVKGMNVVNAIKRVPTTAVGSMRDVPVQAVIIEHVALVVSGKDQNNLPSAQRDDPKVFGRSARGG